MCTPLYKKDIHAVENVQNRATQLVSTVSHLSYQGRIKCLGLPLLEYRRERTKIIEVSKMDRVKRIWYLSPMRAAKVQASLRIRAVSPEPSLLAHTSSESRGTFRQKARPLAPLNGWACAVKLCHDGMLEDTNSLDGAQIITTSMM